MTSTTETRAEAWERRSALRGDVDFTMMYVAHDAFARDLARLVSAAASGEVLTAPARNTWTLFSRMLDLHHTAEDVSLWPALEAAVSDPRDLATLVAMEEEHASLDPLVDAIGSGFSANRADDVARDLELLNRRLHAHLRHEEDEALPLLERTLGADGWAAFGQQVRQTAGMKEMATMLPWLLESAHAAAAAAVLDTLPPPVRTLHRTVWSRNHRRTELLR